MGDYTVTLTSAEEKALKSVMVDIKEWSTNITKVRAEKATIEITTNDESNQRIQYLTYAMYGLGGWTA